MILESPAMFWSRSGGFKVRNNKGVLMKKLMMFAAAMTIVGGAFAECNSNPTVTNNCALVYDVKITAKTTVGKYLSGSVIATSGCSSTTNPATCYRVLGSVSLKGYYTSCSCDCEGFLDPTVVLWNPKAKVQILVGGWSWTLFNRIGKKSTDVEGFFTAGLESGTLFGAGFGKWDSKYDRLTSISGNIVGYGTAPECATGNCDASVAYPCGVTEGVEAPTAASGTWSLKYNKKQSANLAAGNIENLDLPDYVSGL